MAGRVLTGEDAFIADYLAPLSAGFPGAFGLTDDCAELEPLPGHALILKTDPVIAGVHFFSNDAAADIAWKALAVNVSDLAAKALYGMEDSSEGACYRTGLFQRRVAVPDCG